MFSVLNAKEFIYLKRKYLVFMPELFTNIKFDWKIIH